MQRAEGRLAAEVDEVIDAIEVEIDVDAEESTRDSGWLWPSRRFSMSWLSEGYIFDEFTELARFGSSASGGRCSCKFRYFNNARWYYGCCGIRSG